MNNQSSLTTEFEFSNRKTGTMRNRFLSVSLGLTVYASSPVALASQQTFTMAPLTITPVHVHATPTVQPTQFAHTTSVTHNTSNNHQFSSTTTNASATNSHHPQASTAHLPITSHSASLNLNSSVQNFNVSALGGFHQLSINLGGKTEVVTLATKLTGAEAIAVAQIANGEKQSILIGADGKAVGGTFNVDNKVLASIDQLAGGTIASLVVPNHITLKDSVSQFTLTGGLINNGHIIALANGGTSSDTISASSIYNGTTGSITTAKAVDLTLQANQNISNAGQILASSALNLSAGAQITNLAHSTITAAHSVNVDAPKIVNAGTLTSTDKNVSFTSNSDIDLNNAGGSIQAQHGDINFRDSAYLGASNINVSGGSLLSQNLNLNSGTGTVTVDAPTITGAINGTAGAAHVNSQTENLKLGNLDVSGDPTYYNQGNITITNSIAVAAGQDLAIVASGNVVSSGGILNTSSDTGNGGSIFISAGDPFTTSNNSTAGNSDSTTTLTLQNITGTNQGAGGYIDLTGASFKGGAPITALNTASTKGAGGNVTLIAFGGTATNSGTVKLPTTLTVNTSSSNGAGGNVTIYAGAPNTANAPATGISIGSINASGGGINSTTNAQNSGGSVDIETGNPQVTSGNITVLNGTTNLAVMQPPGTPNTVTLSTTNSPLAYGTISAQNISSSGGNVTVLGQSTITLGNIITSGAGGLPTTSASATNGGNGANAGAVTIGKAGTAGNAANISVGNILAYGGGGAGGSAVSQTSGNNGGTGGNGGVVTIDAKGALTVGNVNTSGGGGGGGATGGAGGLGGTAADINIEGTSGVRSNGILTSVNGGNGGDSTTTSGGGGGGASYGGGGGGGAGTTLDSGSASAGGSGGGGAFGGGGGASSLGNVQQGGAGGGFNGGGTGGLGDTNIPPVLANSGSSGNVNSGGAGNGGFSASLTRPVTVGGLGLGFGGAGGASPNNPSGSSGESVTPKSGNFTGGNLNINQRDPLLATGKPDFVGTLTAPLKTLIGGEFAITGQAAYINQGGAFNFSTATPTPLQLGSFANVVISAFGDINVNTAIGNTTANSLTLITQAGSGGNINIAGSLTTSSSANTYINLMADGSINATGLINTGLATMSAKENIEADQLHATWFGGIAGGQQLTLKDFNDNAFLGAYGTGTGGTSTIVFNGANASIGQGAFNSQATSGLFAAYNPSLPDVTRSSSEQVSLSFASGGTIGVAPLPAIFNGTIFPTHISSTNQFGTTGAQSVTISGNGTVSGLNSLTTLNATTITLNGSATGTSFGTNLAPLALQASSLNLTGGTGTTTDFLYNSGVAPLTVSANGISTLSLTTKAPTTLDGVNASGAITIQGLATNANLLIGSNGIQGSIVSLSSLGGIQNAGANAGLISANTIELQTAGADVGTLANAINVKDQTFSVVSGAGNAYIKSLNTGASTIAGGTTNSFNYQGTTDHINIEASINSNNVVLNVASVSGNTIGDGRGAVTITTNDTTSGNIAANLISGTNVALTTAGTNSTINISANTPNLTFSSSGNVDINLTGTAVTTIASTGTVNTNQPHVNITARGGVTIAANTSLGAGQNLNIVSGGVIQNLGTISASELTLVATTFDNASSGFISTESLAFGSATQASGIFNDTGVIQTTLSTIYTPTLTIAGGGELVSGNISVLNPKGSLSISGTGFFSSNYVTYSAAGNLTLGSVVSNQFSHPPGVPGTDFISLSSGGVLTTTTGILMADDLNAPGGTISVNAATWNYGGATSKLDLIVSSTQQGSFDGGTVNLHLTGNQNLAFGTPGAGSNNSISAGNGTGSGGSISVSTGGNISALSSALVFAGDTQVAGNLSLVAGSTMLLDLGSSSLPLTGTAQSGKLVVGSGSVAPFQIGAVSGGGAINGITSVAPSPLLAGGITISSPNISIAKNESVVALNNLQINTATLTNNGVLRANDTLGIANPNGALLITSQKGGGGDFQAAKAVNLASNGALTVNAADNDFTNLYSGAVNSFTVAATNGILNLGRTGVPVLLSVTPDGTTGVGGNLSISAKSITGFSTLSFLAEGGTGSAPAGGNISLALSGTTPLSIGPSTVLKGAPTTYSFNNSTLASTDGGGSISIANGGNLYVDPTGITTSGANPTVSLAAGAAPSGQLQGLNEETGIAPGQLYVTNLATLANEAHNGTLNLSLTSNSTSTFALAGASLNTNGGGATSNLFVNNLTIQNLNGSISNGATSANPPNAAISAVLIAGGNGIIGTSSLKVNVPFSISTGKLSVFTSGAGSANIKDTNDESVTLIAASTGKSFTYNSFDALNVIGPINATSITLNTEIGANPVNTNATSIIANTTNTALTLNDSATSAVTLQSIAGNGFTFNASGSVSIANAINAPLVNINAGGAAGSITIGTGVIGQTGGVVALTASGTGTITDLSTASAQVTASNLSLNAGSGSIGLATHGLATAADNTIVTTNGAVYVNNTLASNASFTAGSTTSQVGAVSISENVNTLNINDIYATGGIAVMSTGNITQVLSGANINSKIGNVNLTSSGTSSQLIVGSGSNIAASNGNILLLNSSTTGSISLGSNSTVNAFAPVAGSGNVTLAIGRLPVKGSAIGVNPGSFITPTIVSPGNIYYGPLGIISGIGSNILFADGANIIFSNSASTPGQIQFGGGVSITADPPATAVLVPSSTPTPDLAIQISPAVLSLLPAQNSTSGISGTPINNQSIQAFDRNTGAYTINPNQIGLAQSNGSAAEQPASAIGTLNLSAAITTTVTAATPTFLELNQVSSMLDVVSKTTTRRSASGLQTRIASVQELNNGAALLSPKEISTVKTPYGIVKLSPNTLALLIVNEDGLSIFNLHENRAASIKVENCGFMASVCVGQSLHLSPAKTEKFEELNPVQYVGYKNINRKTISPELTVFRAEYSIPMLIGGLDPLKEIISSSEKERRVIANNLLKTVALMSQMGNQSQNYELMQPNSITAMVPAHSH